MSESEYQESTTIHFEWTLRGLKNLFDASKGDVKSRATKSVKFGGGRWQILFYANSGLGSSGSDGASYVSLFLSCEPTVEEKEKGFNGRWIREGLFRFTFELRNLSKTMLFNAKEAHDHSFSYNTANWGWAQFAKRDSVYYSPSSVRQADAFVILCTISSSPSQPRPPPFTPMRMVPRVLVDSVGTLLDDPLYSDVEFVLPRKGQESEPRRIWAAKKLLRRADYFSTMFESGFAEASNPEPVARGFPSHSLSFSPSTDVSSFGEHFEDSDEEDEGRISGPNEETASTRYTQARDEGQKHVSSDLEPVSLEETTGVADTETEADESAEQHAAVTLSRPSSARGTDVSLGYDDSILPSTRQEALLGPKKTRIVVRDVAYTTYRAVLYYIYTDVIHFAPLSSSFLYSSSQTSASTGVSFDNAGTENQSINQKPDTSGGFRSRSEWLRQWELDNPGKPRPCSAKAAYRLADKLDLRELKDRAFQHIMKGLTVDNVPYEVFSTFSATFEDVRKLQVQFFLDHWTEIRGSEAMRNVWQQIRLGRHPGFEEVWPYIALNLEFKPSPVDGLGSSGKSPAIEARHLF